MTSLLVTVKLKNISAQKVHLCVASITELRHNCWEVVLTTSNNIEFRIREEGVIESLRMLKDLIEKPLTHWPEIIAIQKAGYTRDQIYNCFSNTPIYMAMNILSIIIHDTLPVITTKSNKQNTNIKNTSFFQEYFSNQNFSGDAINKFYFIDHYYTYTHSAEIDELYNLSRLGAVEFDYNFERVFQNYFVPFHIPQLVSKQLSPRSLQLWEQIRYAMEQK